MVYFLGKKHSRDVAYSKIVYKSFCEISRTTVLVYKFYTIMQDKLPIFVGLLAVCAFSAHLNNRCKHFKLPIFVGLLLAHFDLSLGGDYNRGMNDITKYNNNHFGEIKISQKDYIFAMEYVKDFNARRAATVTGRNADSGYNIRDKKEVQTVVELFVIEQAKRLGMSADDILTNYADIYRIAMQTGNLNAALKANDGLAKLKPIDAYASSRVDMVLSSDSEMIERIRAGRKRNNQESLPSDIVSFI